MQPFWASLQPKRVAWSGLEEGVGAWETGPPSWLVTAHTLACGGRGVTAGRSRKGEEICIDHAHQEGSCR